MEEVNAVSEDKVVEPKEEEVTVDKMVYVTKRKLYDVVNSSGLPLSIVAMIVREVNDDIQINLAQLNNSYRK